MIVAARIAIMLRQQFAKLTCFHFIALKYYKFKNAIPLARECNINIGI